MCSWLYQQQLEKQYATGLMPGEGVVIKRSKKNFACYPPDLREVPYGLYQMAMELNVRCAMTVNTRVITVMLNSRRTTHDYIPLSDGLRLQVLSSMRDLPQCQKHHFAAFIDDLKILVIWDDNPKKLLARAEALEGELMKVIWGSGVNDDEQDEGKEEKGEKSQAAEVNITAVDLEDEGKEEPRPTKLSSSGIVAVTVALCVSCMGLGLRALAFEIQTDGSYTRLALIAAIPVEMWVAFFFFQSLITNLFQIIGPISAVDKNSRFYSGKPPMRLRREVNRLPHVTIQMPVYKEGLKAVIGPSIQSLKKCISTYALQGGSANIFINDDGMQLISEEDAYARQEFYEENNIGWVARPKHDPKPDDGSQPFLRRGKFKKASNMNYALMVSNRVEDKLVQIPRSPDWTETDEQAVYNHCLSEVLREDQGRTWAEGNVRMGDYILIVDSDTRVPMDCLLDAVSEMEQSPQVAILQFTSGVMQVSPSFFEGGVKWFTNLIYSAITFVVANGDACPFVGHNAILRWSAIQDATAYQDEDGYEKYWSETHVSEDFEMSLSSSVPGWFFGFYDKFYIDSFAIYISVIVVFTGLGNFSLAILRYRLSEMSLLGAFWNNIKWIPLMTIFLGGLSLHVSQALLCHFFSIDMVWGATAKEIEDVNFLEEIPRLLRRFKGTFVWCILMTALIICGYFAFPSQWRIVHLASIWPLAWTVGCHFLLPVVLNPALMVFSW
ncbi:hypothetical protein GL218_05601 [Daldinia childiae]|uniref:uncharacterized protein n=1 Tax=Daldinia childiae TaxID=326645 RepID=UPI001444D98B|nr:uncharacterized protein GL218_05601 [Daldinia childiae]KAF3058252.1 hypothetical protein GL218_05601 [Daldinia childiae]